MKQGTIYCYFAGPPVSFKLYCDVVQKVVRNSSGLPLQRNQSERHHGTTGYPKMQKHLWILCCGFLPTSLHEVKNFWQDGEGSRDVEIHKKLDRVGLQWFQTWSNFSQTPSSTLLQSLPFSSFGCWCSSPWFGSPSLKLPTQQHWVQGTRYYHQRHFSHVFCKLVPPHIR